MRSTIEDVPCGTAEELLGNISPRSPRYEPDPTKWIFRGHAEESWRLRPTGLRSSSVFVPYGFNEVTSSEETFAEQKKILQEFASRLEREGAELPVRSPIGTLGPRAVHGLSTAVVHDPFAHFYPIIALAQHCGLPTLFLDWTRRSKYAAYFAAAEGATNPGARSRIAILAHEPATQDPVGPLSYLTAPGATNPNLQAQSGLFTYLIGKTYGLEEYLSEGNPAGKFVRFLLPRSEAPKLLRLVAEEGVSGATMYPGPQGVLKAMKEKALMDRQIPHIWGVSV